MFILSLIFIVISSYIFTSSLKQNKDNFLYFLLICFSQIVLTFEILSLFSLINSKAFIFSNLIFLLISIIIAKIKNIKIISSFNFQDLKKFISSIKRDKCLFILSFCFGIFLIAQIISTLFFPVLFGDALAYYLTRCTTWIQNGNINHFITPDSRELIMPVNMEFLYTWVLLLRKSEQGIAIFSYISYLAGIYSLFNILKEINLSTRRSIWSILVFSSFVLVAVEMYTPCADLFIGALILTSIYLFIKACKYNNNYALFFSSLSYALAVGTKTTAIIAIPSVFIIFLIIAYKYKSKILNRITNFALLFILNTLIFSSYNYFLNFIHFGNAISNQEQFLLNQFRGGFKGWLSNFIKYCFSIFDTSGIKDFINFNGFITYIQTLVLNIFGLTAKSYTSSYFARYFNFNSNISIMDSMLGIMGLLAFLPSIFKSLKRINRNLILGILGISILLNLIIFSRVMVFTQYNMRYLLTFVVIASPIIAYSYIKKTNFLKILMCIFIFIYLCYIPLKQTLPFTFSLIKFKLTNPNKEFFSANFEERKIYNYLKDKKGIKIALIINQEKSPNYYLEKLKLIGIKIDKLLLENIENYNLEKYDYIILHKNKVSSTNIVNFEDRIKYPTLFVSECTYYDYRQIKIENTSKKPAMVSCNIPFYYLLNHYFSIDENINLTNYIIFKKVQ